jgi:SAM-dependent methyltransferase
LNVDVPAHARDGAPVAGLAMGEDEVFADFASRVRLVGAEVAEIGGSMPEDVLLEHGVARWISIDPHRPAQAGVVRDVRAARAEQMPLADGSVDAVFSSNALQFVDVEPVLAEVARVLRPGGLFYAHFGPIWSGVDGHQLEYVRYGDRDLGFWRDTLLPPWAHLAYARDELAALLRTGLPADLVELLVHHVHDGDTINRLFFEDYVAAALASGLQWVEVTASSEIDYEIAPPDFDAGLLRDVAPDELAGAISQLRGQPTQLGIRDVRMVLRQPTRSRPSGAVDA